MGVKTKMNTIDAWELLSKNPYTDNNGNPTVNEIEISYACSEAAFLHRLAGCTKQEIEEIKLTFIIKEGRV